MDASSIEHAGLGLEHGTLRRVAHLHVLGHGDSQWRHYLELRDRLRDDPAARAAYEATKSQLAAGFIGDPESYSNGKTGLINQILSR